MPVTELPNELLNRILGYCGIGRLRQDTLRSLCLCSKQMKAVAEPLLYSSFEYDEILPFLRTIFHKPELAHHTREFNVTLSNKRAYVPLTFCGTSASTVLLDQAIKSFDSQDLDKNRWFKDIRDDRGDAATALALVLLLRLQLLSIIGTPAPQNDYFITKIVQHVISKRESGLPPSYLQQLANLEFKPKV
jgi:hypothetical protein